MVELTLAARLIRQGHLVAVMPHGHAFDLYVSGYGRVEVKASGQRVPKWLIGGSYGRANNTISRADRVSHLLSGEKCDTIVFVEACDGILSAVYWLDPRHLPNKVSLTRKDISHVARIELLSLPLISPDEWIRYQTTAIAALAGSDQKRRSVKA